MKKTIYDVLAKIEEHNFEVYIVGGYVRDYLRGKDTDDIDLCTNARPKDILEIFKECNIIALEYGNVILKINNFQFEITTFRKDISYIDNRKPIEVEYIDSLEEDLLRRDFTINTICMNKEEKIFDYLGGQEDLKNKLIRSVGDADFKIKEDILRIMRAIRFACRLNFKLEDSLKTAIIENKGMLKQLSYDRKKEELSKIFCSMNKEYGIELLKELNLVSELELINIDNVLLTNDLIGMWATITEDDTYPFTKNEKELINTIKSLLKEDLNDIFVLYKYGRYALSIVIDLKNLNKQEVMDRYNSLAIKDRREIKITTEEICEYFEKEPGYFLKELYDDIEKDILLGNLINEKTEIIKYIETKNIML